MYSLRNLLFAALFLTWRLDQVKASFGFKKEYQRLIRELERLNGSLHYQELEEMRQRLVQAMEQILASNRLSPQQTMVLNDYFYVLECIEGVKDIHEGRIKDEDQGKLEVPCPEGAKRLLLLRQAQEDRIGTGAGHERGACHGGVSTWAAGLLDPNLERLRVFGIGPKREQPVRDIGLENLRRIYKTPFLRKTNHPNQYRPFTKQIARYQFAQNGKQNFISRVVEQGPEFYETDLISGQFVANEKENNPSSAYQTIFDKLKEYPARVCTLSVRGCFYHITAFVYHTSGYVDFYDENTGWYLIEPEKFVAWMSQYHCQVSRWNVAFWDYSLSYLWRIDNPNARVKPLSLQPPALNPMEVSALQVASIAEITPKQFVDGNFMTYAVGHREQQANKYRVSKEASDKLDAKHETLKNRKKKHLYENNKILRAGKVIRTKLTKKRLDIPEPSLRSVKQRSNVELCHLSSLHSPSLSFLQMQKSIKRKKTENKETHVKLTTLLQSPSKWQFKKTISNELPSGQFSRWLSEACLARLRRIKDEEITDYDKSWIFTCTDEESTQIQSVCHKELIKIILNTQLKTAQQRVLLENFVLKKPANAWSQIKFNMAKRWRTWMSDQSRHQWLSKILGVLTLVGWLSAYIALLHVLPTAVMTFGVGLPFLIGSVLSFVGLPCLVLVLTFKYYYALFGVMDATQHPNMLQFDSLAERDYARVGWISLAVVAGLALMVAVAAIVATALVTHGIGINFFSQGHVAEFLHGVLAVLQGSIGMYLYAGLTSVMALCALSYAAFRLQPELSTNTATLKPACIETTSSFSVKQESIELISNSAEMLNLFSHPNLLCLPSGFQPPNQNYGEEAEYDLHHIALPSPRC